MGKTKMDCIQILIKKTTSKNVLNLKAIYWIEIHNLNIKGGIKVIFVLMFALKWDNIGTRLRVYVFERGKANGSLVLDLSNISQGV